MIAMSRSAATKRCPMFCPRACTMLHHPLLIALINTNTTENGETSFTALEATISRYIKLGKWSICDNINDPEPDYRYPLIHWAVSLGKIAVAKWLVHRDKVCVFARNFNTYDTALHLAVISLQKSCQKEASKVFGQFVTILAGALACRNTDGDTPLHLICRSLVCEKPKAEYYSECASHILKFAASRGGAFPATLCNSQNNEGDTPVHILAQKDHTLNIIKIVMELGKVDLNIKNSKKQNALQVAIAHGQMKTSAYLHNLMENAPKKRNGLIVFASRNQQLLENRNVSRNQQLLENRKRKKKDNSPASSCKVTSTEDNTGKPEKKTDQCINDASVSETSENEDGADNDSSPAAEFEDGTDNDSSPAAEFEDGTDNDSSPAAEFEDGTDNDSSPAAKVTSNSPSSTSKDSNPIRSENNFSFIDKLVSFLPDKNQTTKLPGENIPVCASSPSVSWPSSYPTMRTFLATSSSSLSNISVSSSIRSSPSPASSKLPPHSSASSQPSSPAVFSSEPPLNSNPSTPSASNTVAEKSFGPSSAKRKKVKVLVVKKGTFPTSAMVFTDQVQLSSRNPQVTSINHQTRNKPTQNNTGDTLDSEQLDGIKIEKDSAEDDSVRMCPDSNTDSNSELMISSVTSLSGQETPDRNGSGGLGKALMEYLNICGNDHRAGILDVLNKDRSSYQKQKEELNNQIKGVEKEIQEAESEMEEKNNRLKDILLEVEQLQYRVFSLAKQSMCNKQTVKTLQASVGEVNLKLTSCEKAIVDMSCT